jgi:hypothetical protein
MAHSSWDTLYIYIYIQRESLFSGLLGVQNILLADTVVSPDKLKVIHSPDQWVSQCHAIECFRSFYCALFCAL